MDEQFLKYYNKELHHLREMGGEFASQYPKIAGRLGMEGLECADPYVERLLEGFAFLAARVHLKVDAEFPRFTQHLFESIFPHYLAPVPSMAIVRFSPDLSEAGLAQGHVIPRGCMLRSVLGRDDRTPCEYRTAHDVTLWPIELVEAQYYTREIGTLGVPRLQDAKAALRLRLRCTAGLTFDKLSLENLVIYLQGVDETPMRLYAQLFAHATSVIVRPTERPAPWQEIIPAANIGRVGFDNEQSVLPYGPRSFQGYRLLREYFAFPQRFLSVDLGSLGPAIKRSDQDVLDVIILLSQIDLALENAVGASNFSLYCTPAINLFEKRADRIQVSDSQWEFHVVPDRTRPQDYEVYQVKTVSGFGSRVDQERPFQSFYACNELTPDESGAYFAVNRMARVASEKEKRVGRRSSYAGSEVYVSLVDASSAPYRSDLRQLAVTTLCTNRDLPLSMSVGHGNTDFTMESGAPVESIRCIAGPTPPKPSFAHGEISWRLISHLSLNYLSLMDNDQSQGAAALRDLLKLYGDTADSHITKQVDGVKSVTSRPLMRRVATEGPITFARGLEVMVTFDETAFEGTGVFLLGAVLDQFFAKYVSINSFTETVIKTLDRGEVMRWPARIGLRDIL